MSKILKILLALVSVLSLTIIAGVFWNYSRQPNTKETAKAFPDDSLNVFNNGKKITLYSLKPEGENIGAEDFYGYSVINKTEIDGTAKQFLLKHSLINGMAGAYGAACFNPRHELRIVDGEKTLDIVICFECGTFVTYYINKSGEGYVESLFAELIYTQSS